MCRKRNQETGKKKTEINPLYIYNALQCGEIVCSFPFLVAETLSVGVAVTLL